MRGRLSSLGTGVALLLAAPVGLQGQDLWPAYRPSTTLQLEWQKPSPASGSTGFGTGVLYGRAAFPLRGRARLSFELPIANLDPNDGDEGDLQVGNPYVGVDLVPTGARGVFAQFGARIPLASAGEALAVGPLTDWDRLEAWLPEHAAAGAVVGYRHVEPKGLVLAGRVGGTVLVPTNGDLDAEALLNYGARAGYERERVSLHAAFTGRLILTSEDSEDDGTLQLTFGGGYRFGRVMPTLAFRLPLDTPLSTVVDNVIIVGITITP